MLWIGIKKLYGFRLFKVSLRDDIGKRNSNQLNVEDIETYLGCALTEYFNDSLNSLAERKTLLGTPKLGHSAGTRDPIESYLPREGEKALKGDDHIVFKKFSQIEPHILFGELDYGKIGSHKWLHDVIQGVSDISGSAPSDTYRCAFFIPEQGDSLLIATETKGRINVASKVALWMMLQSWSKQQSKAANRSLGMDLVPVRDFGSLVKLIEDANAVNIRLTKKSVNPDSGRDAKEILFEQRILGSQKREQVIDAVKRWVRKLASTDEPEEQWGSTGIVEITNLTDLSADDSGISFTDGYITIQKDRESPKKIAPDKLDDVFTYILGENQVKDEVWIEKVTHVIRRLENDLPMKFLGL